MANHLLPRTCIWLSKEHKCTLPDNYECPELESPINDTMSCEFSKEELDCIIEAMKGEFMEDQEVI